MKTPRDLTAHRPIFRLQSELSLQYLILPAILMLGACGSSGDDAVSAPPVALAAGIDVTEGDSSPLADAVDTQTLQQMSARNVAQGIAVNLGGAQRLNESGTSVFASSSRSSSTLLEDATSIFSHSTDAQLFSDEAGLGTEEIDTSRLSLFDGLFDNTASDQATRLVEATLGLGDSDGASVQRSGNIITIDPDDAVLCELMQGDDQGAAAMQIDVCQQVVSNLTVELEAVTEQSGEIAYLYNNQPLLGIAYGPVNAAYTLNLGTLFQVEQYFEQLSGTVAGEDATQQVQGSVRLQSRVVNNTQDQEAGTARVELLDALQVKFMDGSSFSMAPSLLLSMDHDDALGTVNVEMALGATEFKGSTSDPLNMSFGGFTARMDMDDSVGSFIVSNLEFVDEPLLLTDDNGFTLSLALQAFGFVFEESIEQLVFNSALDFMLNVTFADSNFGISSYGFNLSGPAGVRLNTTSDSESAVNLISGGPLQLDYTVSATENSETGFVTWSPGSCQGSTSLPQDESVIMQLLGC